MKAQGLSGLCGFTAMVGAALLVSASIAIADDPTASPPVIKPVDIPKLTARFTNDTLRLSWPSRATNWMLSTQVLDGKTWTFVAAKFYQTNGAETYFESPASDQAKCYRLVRTAMGFRNRFGQPIVTPALPPMPSAPPKAPRPKAPPAQPNQ